MEILLEIILTLGCGLYVNVLESIAPERKLKDGVALFLKILGGIIFFVTILLIFVGVWVFFDSDAAIDRRDGVIMMAVGFSSLGIHILLLVIIKCLKSYKELQIRRQRVALLGSKVCVVVDKPIGSPHPVRPDTVCAVNCGYVLSDDEQKHDAYILGKDEPVGEFIGTIKAIICRWNDGTELWVVAPNDLDVTQSMIREKTDFCERNFESYIIM